MFILFWKNYFLKNLVWSTLCVIRMFCITIFMPFLDVSLQVQGFFYYIFIIFTPHVKNEMSARWLEAEAKRKCSISMFWPQQLVYFRSIDAFKWQWSPRPLSHYLCPIWPASRRSKVHSKWASIVPSRLYVGGLRGSIKCVLCCSFTATTEHLALDVIAVETKHWFRIQFLWN